MGVVVGRNHHGHIYLVLVLLVDCADHVRVAGHQVLPLVVGADPLPRRLSDVLPVLQAVAHPVGQGVIVSRFREEAGLHVPHQFRRGPPSPAHDRDPARHRLTGGDVPRLAGRRQPEIRVLHHLLELQVGHGPGDAHVLRGPAKSGHELDIGHPAGQLVHRFRAGHHVYARLGPEDIICVLLLGLELIELDPVWDDDHALAHVAADGLRDPL